ncbi:MAG: sigma 54-interacting transcriptional regulator [Bdellovibrionales bacterium]|nr:sigma 54-interacting transcriptional regulator [Bdellovibrionales bacterium]
MSEYVQDVSQGGVDWEQVKSLRVTRKIVDALNNLEVKSLYLTPANRRKDARKKYLGYGSRKMLSHAQTPFFFHENSEMVDLIGRDTQAFEKYQESCNRAVEEALSEDPVAVVQDDFGMQHQAIAIRVKGEVVGVIRCGDYISGKVDDLTVAKISENFLPYSIDQSEVTKAIRKLPFFTSEKVAVIQNLLQMLAGEIGVYLDEGTQNENSEENEKYNFEGLITKSPMILDIINQIKLIGASDSSVIIYGESGTGKELVANLIHKKSKRVDQPFVTINCAALTETILEAELFGYRKGAFTGAVADKKGLFEVADRGTVFLDEVGEMSLSLQVKILRLIQEGTFMRVGDTEMRKVNVRIISATHRDLRKFIELGKFREDLYYRLAVVELTLPPLRDRTEDIPILISHFLDHFGHKTSKRGIKLSQEVIKIFEEYYWPGNIRELRNEVERIVALKPGNSLVKSKDLSKKFFYETYPEGIQVGDENEEGFIKRLVDEFEKSLLSKYLRKHKWNKTKVARLCGITRQGLNKKISKYRLDRRRI